MSNTNDNIINILHKKHKFINKQPYKIIYKYYNVYKKIKYITYIFIGNEINQNIINVLNKIMNV